MRHVTLSFIAAILICLASQATGQTGQWIKYTTANSGLQSDSISAFAFDGSGGVWIGSVTEGLALFKGIWTIFNDYTKVPGNNIFALSNANGSIWIGTNYGLTKTDGSTWNTYTSANSNLVDDGIWSIAPDENHNLWVGTDAGLSELKADNTWSTYTSDLISIFPDNHFLVVAPDMRGSVWTSFVSAYGMVKFSVANPANAKLINQESIIGFPADHIVAITTDWSGDAWAGTFYQGVVKTDGTTATEFSTTTDPNWISDNVRAVAVDQCGHIWVGTDRGAARYDGAWTVHKVSMAQLPNDTVNTISVDPAGHIWFGTNGGIAEFKPAPEKLALVYPANAADISTDSITCRWNWACPGIQKYWFEIADNPSFTNSHIDTTSASLTEWASAWDTNLVDHATYYWRVKAENDAGWGPFSNTWNFTVNLQSGVASNEKKTPHSTLAQNFPNPFSNSTAIRYSLPERAKISLTVYDVLGRECVRINQSEMGPGDFTARISASDLPHSGFYIYRLRAGNDIEQRTMQIVR